jgi:hypothetical protein
VNRHDVTDEQWEGLAEVVPLRGGDSWPSWPGHRTLHGAGPGGETYGDGTYRERGHGDGAGAGEPSVQDEHRRFVVIRVRYFADARGVAEQLMGHVPVLLDLTVADGDVAKRILDFASGVVFGLGASMHRVDTNVFLLTPVGTRVEGPRLGAATGLD